MEATNCRCDTSVDKCCRLLLYEWFKVLYDSIKMGHVYNSIEDSTQAIEAILRFAIHADHG